MENDFIILINTRRSCLKYKTQQVDDQLLEEVLKAGTYAPTGHGSQSPFIVAVQNSEQRATLTKMNAKVMGVTSDPYYGAPTIVLVFAPDNYANAFQDGSCVLENMMLAAHALGLASCWINREHEMFMTDEGKELMKQWGLPDGLIGIGALSLGYADAEPKEPKPRKEDYYRVIR